MEKKPVENGNICHIEIPAPNVQESKDFYSTLFGWDCNDIPGMDYAFFSAGPIGGGFDPKLDVSEKGVNVVIKVDSIDDKLNEIAEAGGDPLKEKTEIPGGFGYFATFKDPAGNRLSLWQN